MGHRQSIRLVVKKVAIYSLYTFTYRPREETIHQREQPSKFSREASSKAAEKDSIILGTFSTDTENDKPIIELAMNVLLDTTKNMLDQVLKFASLRCRRDHLWNMLFKNLPDSAKAKDNANSTVKNTMSILELKELLGHVQIQKLDVATRSLKEMSESSNVSPMPTELEDNVRNIQEWQTRLIGVLKEKYCHCHRHMSSDNEQFQVKV